MDNQDHAEWNIEIDRVVIEGIRLTSYQQQLLKEKLRRDLITQCGIKRPPSKSAIYKS